MKYRVLIDYHTEGWRFHDEGEGYDTIDAAVKEGIANSYGHPFLVIQVIDWQARETNQPLS